MGGDAFPFPEEPKKQMLGTDVVVTHPARFLEGDLEDLLDARGRDDLLDDDPLVAAEQGLDRVADIADLDAKVVKDLAGQALILAEQSQEQVLGTDIAVMRLFGFFLGERQSLPGSLSEPLERVHVLSSLGPGLGPPPPRLHKSRCGPPVRAYTHYLPTSRRRPWRGTALRGHA